MAFFRQIQGNILGIDTFVLTHRKCHNGMINTHWFLCLFSLLNHNCTCFLRRFSSFSLSWKEKKNVKLKQIDNRCTALPASHCFAIRSSICQSRGWKVSFKNSRFYITRSIWLEGTIKKPLSYSLSSWNLGNSRSGGGVGRAGYILWRRQLNCTLLFSK